jgi:hypothetical protein
MPDNPVVDILEARYRTEDEEAVNKWYDEFHMPVLFKSKYVRSIARYKVPSGSPDYVRYFTILRYDSQSDFEKFLASPEFAAAGEKSPEMQSIKIEGGPPVHGELAKEWV